MCSNRENVFSKSHQPTNSNNAQDLTLQIILKMLVYLFCDKNMRVSYRMELDLKIKLVTVYYKYKHYTYKEEYKWTGIIKKLTNLWF